MNAKQWYQRTAHTFRTLCPHILFHHHHRNISPNGVVGMEDHSTPCKSHKEAERRRRQRINAHLSTLRSLLPNSTKTDKASLLAEVVNHVNDLRSQASRAARDSTLTGDSDPWPFPSELDEATLSYCHDDCDSGSKPRLMKATVCCEDRPGLNRDLTQAIRSVRARAVRAEIVTLGGRTKSVVVMKWAGGDEQFQALKRALKAIVENRAAHGFSTTKRSRVFSSVDDYML